MPGDIIILHKCSKNHDHMLYYSWDMAFDKCNCHFSFWAIFLPFYPPNNRKIENFKKIKKCLEISSFYTSVSKIMIICYTVKVIWHVTNVIVIFHFGLFFTLLPCNSSPKNQNFMKNEKNFWRYHYFTHVYQKLWLDDVQFLRHGVRWTNRWMDRRKSDI